MRLESQFRAALYGILAFLFATGAAWFVADRLKDTTDGELWQLIAANLLMFHGGAAMVTLLFLGALGPVHIKRGWRSHKNRISGIVMVSVNVILIVTAFGLYYAGAEMLRPWISNIHLALGLGLPALLLIHILIGKHKNS